MPKLTDEQKGKILKALSDRGVTRPCARCGNPQFSLIDTLSAIPLGDGKSIIIGGQVVPSAVVACTKCGAVSFHALGVLGLFEEFGFKP